MEVLLSPSKHRRRIQSSKEMSDRVLSELNLPAGDTAGEEAARDPSLREEKNAARSTRRREEREAALKSIMDARAQGLARLKPEKQEEGAEAEA